MRLEAGTISGRARSAFKRQGSLDDQTWESLPTILELSRHEFMQCIREVGREVENDLALARQFDVSVTPTFLIGTVQPNNTVKISDVIVGAMPLERFSEALDPLVARTATGSF